MSVYNLGNQCKPALALADFAASISKLFVCKEGEFPATFSQTEKKSILESEALLGRGTVNNTPPSISDRTDLDLIEFTCQIRISLEHPIE